MKLARFNRLALLNLAITGGRAMLFFTFSNKYNDFQELPDKDHEIET